MLIGIISLIAVTAFAQTPSVPLSSVSELLFQQVYRNSPLGLYETGKSQFGAYILDPQSRHCDTAHVNLLFSIVPWGKGMVLYSSSDRISAPPTPLRPQALFTAQELNEGLQAEIQRYLRQLAHAMDPAAQNRQICLGLAKFPGINANSSILGYLFFDPRILFLAEKNSMHSLLSYPFVAAHEFAHQVQYWHNDPFLNDQSLGLTSRRSELTADCVAGTILTLQYRRDFSDADWIREKAGLVTAPIQLGDFDLRDADHHGTGYERSVAVEHGVRLGLQAIQNRSPLASGTMLNACHTFIQRMDQRYNPTLRGNWPFGALVLH